MGIPLTGGSVPALIWRDTMKVATESYGNVDFSYEPIDIIKEKPQIESNYIPSEEIMEDESDEENNQNINSSSTKSHTVTTDEAIDNTPTSSSVTNNNSVNIKTTTTKQINVENHQEHQANTNLPEPKPSEGD